MSESVDDNSIDPFDQYIIFDPNTDQLQDDDDNNTDNKENIDDDKNAEKPRKAKKIQFCLITDFMKEHQTSTDKAMDDQMWERLCSDLNAAGPPQYTPQEWKTKWTSHLYNVNKRKRSPRNLNQGDRSKIIRQDQQTSTFPIGNKNVSTQFVLKSSVTPTSCKQSPAVICSSVHGQDESSGQASVSSVGRGHSFPSIPVERLFPVHDTSTSSIPIDENITSSPIHGHQYDSTARILVNENVLVRNQSTIIKRLDSVIERLDKSNNLLEELVKVKK